MKKQILNIGKALNRVEQKTINGGKIPDLNRACGYVVFTSIESQCLGLAEIYQPIWNPVTQKCSALGQGTNCDEIAM